MNFEYKHLLPKDFNDNSRVWIYQSNRLFTSSEAFQIEDLLNDFVANWKSHGVPVKGYSNLFFGQFIILMADENSPANSGISGCSIDSSVHVIQKIEQQFHVDMMNWQSLAFIVNDKVQIISRQQLNYALENNFITAYTLYFNNLVATKRELEEKWLMPVSGSWLKSKIKRPV